MMNDYVDMIVENRNEITRLKSRFGRIEHYVMESKRFEGLVIVGVLLFYAYLAFHIGVWIVRMILG